MTRSARFSFTISMKLLSAAFLAVMLFSAPARAERADSEKPVHLEADRATVQDANKLATFIGNVVLTQGTLIIRADKMTVKEDANGFQYATAFGNLASFSIPVQREYCRLPRAA